MFISCFFSAHEIAPIETTVVPIPPATEEATASTEPTDGTEATKATDEIRPVCKNSNAFFKPTDTELEIPMRKQISVRTIYFA